jgi:hypothetical protein
MPQQTDISYKQLNNYLVAVASTIANMREKNMKPTKTFFDALFYNLKNLIPVDKTQNPR